MASLKSVLQTKLARTGNSSEENLETGRVWMYTETNTRNKLWPSSVFCWRSPAAGTAIIEVWGAGGSGARTCCCGFGIPGNSGSYAKKTITVTGTNYITGTIGFSCGNADAQNFRGCSESTGVCWISSTTNGCICAQGGRGGTTICSTTPSAYCCFTAANFCTTKTLNENCGVACNYGTGTASCCAQAYGGDINCYGKFNCAGFFGCLPNCVCQYQYHIYIPPGFISTGGTTVTYQTENDNGAESWTGMGLFEAISAINAAGKNPTQGGFYNACWTGNRTCGCYEAQGCTPFMPVGVGGGPAHPCADHRSQGFRGGHGGVRIKFIAST
jgi:hypothetical protein